MKKIQKVLLPHNTTHPAAQLVTPDLGDTNRMRSSTPRAHSRECARVCCSPVSPYSTSQVVYLGLPQKLYKVLFEYSYGIIHFSLTLI
jgi:hypothetical protein